MDRAHVTSRENERTNERTNKRGRDAARNAIFGVLRDATRRGNRFSLPLRFFSLSHPRSPESLYCGFNGIVLRPFNRSCNSPVLPPRRSREAIDGGISCVWHRLNHRTRDEKLITPSSRYNPGCDADSPHYCYVNSDT